MSDTKISEGTGLATLGKGRNMVTQKVEVNMQRALLRAHNEGINDPAVLKSRMEQARKEAKA